MTFGGQCRSKIGMYRMCIVREGDIFLQQVLLKYQTLGSVTLAGKVEKKDAIN